MIGKEKHFVTVVARAYATAGGVGYSPLAPGTCGTIVAVPIAAISASLAWWAFLLITTAVTLAGIWAAKISDGVWGSHDSGRIVIDEVAGYFLTVALVPRDNWTLLLLGFVLFRFFDIVKPPPIRWLDENLPGGVGVMLDDIGAGVFAGGMLLFANHIGLAGDIERLLGIT